jgi:hypothetical protein
MTSAGGDLYQINITNLTQIGSYDLSVTANDTSSNSNTDSVTISVAAVSVPSAVGGGSGGGGRGGGNARQPECTVGDTSLSVSRQSLEHNGNQQHVLRTKSVNLVLVSKEYVKKTGSVTHTQNVLLENDTAIAKTSTNVEPLNSNQKRLRIANIQ